MRITCTKRLIHNVKWLIYLLMPPVGWSLWARRPRPLRWVAAFIIRRECPGIASVPEYGWFVAAIANYRGWQLLTPSGFVKERAHLRRWSAQ